MRFPWPPPSPGPLRSSGAVPALLATRVATAGLWLLVAAGAVGGPLALLARAAPAPPRARPPAPRPLAPSGFAELYVGAFLSAGQDAEAGLRAFLPGAPALIGVVAGDLYAARTATLGARQVAPGYWSVVVAAEVLARAEGAYRPAGTRFYEVGVAVSGDALVATALPAEVAAPPLAPAPRLAFSAAALPPGDARAEAVGGFLSAYLAGQGPLERYVAPGSRLRPVRPAPFAAVAVTRLAAEAPGAGPPGRERVAAEVKATDASGRAQVLGYALGLAEREGRWEVTDLTGAPPLAAHGPPLRATTKRKEP